MKICKGMSSGELLTGRRGGNETCFELEAPKRRFGVALSITGDKHRLVWQK